MHSQSLIVCPANRAVLPRLPRRNPPCTEYSVLRCRNLAWSSRWRSSSCEYRGRDRFHFSGSMNVKSPIVPSVGQSLSKYMPVGGMKAIGVPLPVEDPDVPIRSNHGIKASGHQYPVSSGGLPYLPVPVLQQVPGFSRIFKLNDIGVEPVHHQGIDAGEHLPLVVDARQFKVDS